MLNERIVKYVALSVSTFFIVALATVSLAYAALGDCDGTWQAPQYFKCGSMTNCMDPTSCDNAPAGLSGCAGGNVQGYSLDAANMIQTGSCTAATYSDHCTVCSGGTRGLTCAIWTGYAVIQTVNGIKNCQNSCGTWDRAKSPNVCK